MAWRDGRGSRQACFVREAGSAGERRHTCDRGHFTRVRGRLTHALCRVDWNAVKQRIAQTPGGIP